MKKTIIAAISIILMLFAFVACDGEPTKPSETEQLAEEVTSSVNDILKAIFTDAMKLETKNNVAWETKDYSGTYDFVVESNDNSWDLTVVGDKIEEEAAPKTKANEETSHDIEFKLASEDVADEDSEINITIAGSDEPIKIKVSEAVKSVTFPKEEEPEEETTPVSEILEAAGASFNLGGLFGSATVSDIQSDVKITEAGAVTGTFNYVKATSDWNVENEEEGYYFLFKVKKDSNTEFTTTVNPPNAGQNNSTTADPEKAVFLGKTAKLASEKKITVTLEGKSVTLSFEGATFNSWVKPAAAADEISFTEGDVVGVVSDFQSGVSIDGDGVVNGTFEYAAIPEWGVAEQDEGFYLCVNLDLVGDDDEVKVNDKTIKGQKEWIIFLGKTLEDVKAKKVDITVTKSENTNESETSNESRNIKLDFTNVVCKETSSDFAMPITTTVDFGEGEYDATEYQSNVKISKNGVVKGGFKYGQIPDWGNTDNEGYYLFVSFAVEDDTEVIVTGDKENKATDKDWILFLGTDPESKPKQFVVTVGDKKKITLTFSEDCEFEKEQTSTDET